MLKLDSTSGRSSKSMKAEGKSDDDDDANDFNEDDLSFYDAIEKTEGKNLTMEARSDGDSERAGGMDDEGYYKKGSGGLSN